MNLSNHNKAVVALIVANVIWGAGAPIFKWSLQDIEPFTLAFMRFFFAALILLPFVFTKLIIKREHFWDLIFFSITGITVNISFFFLALQKTQSINVPIIGSSAAIFIILGSMMFLKEQPKRKVIAGTTLSLLGVITIVLSPFLTDGIHTLSENVTSFVGNIFLIIAVLGSVIHTLILRRIAKVYPTVTLTFWSFMIGFVSFIPLTLFESFNTDAVTIITVKSLIGIIYGAVFASTIAYLTYNYALKYMVANEAGIFYYLDPVVAAIIAIPLLEEVITVPYISGSFLVFLGIFLAEGRLPYHPLHKFTK
ncbi:MAG: DMT family transporter [Candidatus Levybacteria bacterium]|nr:DMT family transporter [Candidatus Levybacteria bacterium]